MRLKRQISRQNREYQQLEKKYNKMNKKRFNKASKTENDSKKTWKSEYHRSSLSAPKAKKKNKRKKTTPKLMEGVSAPICSNVSRKNRKRNNNNGPPKSVKRQVSRRYDEGFGIKIKGLSTLNLFFEEYEKEKQKEKEEKQNSDDQKQVEKKKNSLELDQSVVNNVDIEDDEFFGQDEIDYNSNEDDKFLKLNDD